MAKGDLPEIIIPRFPIRVSLNACETGSPVDAKLVELTTQLAKTKIGSAWWSGLGVSKSTRELEGDHSWDWAAEIGKHRNDLFVESVAVQTDDDQVQGAMIYRLDGDSVLADGNGAVFIDRLATAPRNRDWLVTRPLYRGAGTTLLRWAAYHSYLLGLEGRIVLASLPSARTIEFYVDRGFVQTEAEKDDMIVFELEPEAAANLMKQAESFE